MPSLQIDVHCETDHAVVAVHGDLDVESSDELLWCAELSFGRGVRDLVVQLEHVSFCDSSGFESLRRLVRRGSEVGARVVIDRPSPAVRRLVGLLGPVTAESPCATGNL